MELVKMAFDYAKKDREGELSKHEYKVAMTALFGHPPDKWELQKVFQNSNRSVTYCEFLHWAQKKGFGSDFVDPKCLFVLLDKDIKGHLVTKDFCSASEETALKVSKTVWRRAFREMDQRKKGSLNLDDLTMFMNGNVSMLID